MKVLITGGYGFIGRHAAERFHKEGHTVHIIDKRTADKDEQLPKHFHYGLDVADPQCEEVFRAHNVDCVLHLATMETVDGSPAGVLDTNISGLANMLELARRYAVKKFVFVSQATAPDAGHEPAAAAASLPGLSKELGEELCRKWRQHYGLDTVVLRLAAVYGPGQTAAGAGGVVHSLMESFLDGRAIAWDDVPPRDYIYVADVVDALYRAATTPSPDGPLTISANAAYDPAQIIAELAQLRRPAGTGPEDAEGARTSRPGLDNATARQHLGWAPKYQLADGLWKTFQWFQQKGRPSRRSKSAQGGGWLKTVQPYLENVALFAVAGTLGYLTFGSGSGGFQLGFDYNYVYIAVMGFLYGKRQSILATGLAAAAFTAGYLGRGGDLVAMVYQIQYLVHLAVYLCIGVVTGYATDNRERAAAETRREMDQLQQRYDFLSQIYRDCSRIKDDLYSQVVNSEDSLGKIYSVVRELDSLEFEDVYTGAGTIVASVMRTNAVSIYTVNKSGTYLRKKTCTSSSLQSMPNSIKVADNDYIKTIMESQKVFVNRELCGNCPLMAAPIVHEGRTIAVLMISDLPFENITLYYVNLFKILAMLITDALARAYFFDESLQDKKYFEGTRILRPVEFEKVVQAIAKRKQMFGMNAAMIRLVEPPADYEDLSAKLSGVIRAEDYLGGREDGQVSVLLLNTVEGTVADVRERFRGLGIETVEDNVDGER